MLGVNVQTLNRWAVAGTVPVVLKVPGPRGANLFERGTIRTLALRRREEVLAKFVIPED